MSYIYLANQISETYLPTEQYLSLLLPFPLLCSLQHKAIKDELREKQEDMDQLIRTVEDLQRELEKVPNCEMSSIQRDTETLREQWLAVSGL